MFRVLSDREGFGNRVWQNTVLQFGVGQRTQIDPEDREESCCINCSHRY